LKTWSKQLAIIFLLLIVSKNWILIMVLLRFHHFDVIGSFSNFDSF